MNITICGGGNLGHVTAAFFAAQDDNVVSLLTTQPDKWSHGLEVVDFRGYLYCGQLNVITDNAKEVIPNADIVLLCLPGYAIHGVLTSIAPYLSTSTWVGSVVSSTGFFFDAFDTLSSKQPIFGFQRVPFISRIVEYGHKAELKGYKDALSIAIEQTKDKELMRQTLEFLFKTPIQLLDSYYEVSLSNSNPLLHTSRLYTMWKDWKSGIVYDRNPEFYSEWTLEASELLLDMDCEFQTLIKLIGLKNGAIPSVLNYYECVDARSLTDKIQSIPAFKGIYSPMIQVEKGWIPDFHSRYFTEDFPYGLSFIIRAAQEHGCKAPIMTKVFEWGINKC